MNQPQFGAGEARQAIQPPMGSRSGRNTYCLQEISCRARATVLVCGPIGIVYLLCRFWSPRREDWTLRPSSREAGCVTLSLFSEGSP